MMNRYPHKQKRMAFDDELNLYGETVKDGGYDSKLNMAYYVVVGKKVYAMVLTHDFYTSWEIGYFKRSILNHTAKRKKGGACL